MITGVCFTTKNMAFGLNTGSHRNSIYLTLTLEDDN